jgi:hypothetical protein
MLSAAAIARACPQEIAALDASLAQARTALAYYLPARAAFHDAKVPNAAATAAVVPVMNRWLDEHGAPAERREIGCQGDACKVKVTEPWPPRPPWVHRAPGAKSSAELDRIARDVRLEGPVQDRDGSAEIAKTYVWLRLRSPDGQSASAPPPFPALLAPSAALAVRSERPPRTEECRAAVAEREGELDSLRQRAEKELSADVLFEKETAANPALAARLQPLVARAHAAPGTPEVDRATLLTVECRGLVCKVDAPAGVQVKGATMKVLLDEKELATQVRRVSFETKNDRAAGPLYFTIVPTPHESRTGGDVLRYFVNQLRRENFLEDCKQRAPGKGKLSVQLLVPGAGETNHDGVAGRISFRLADSLADAPFGRCIAERLAARASSFELPPDVTRAEVSKTFEVP